MEIQAVVQAYTDITIHTYRITACLIQIRALYTILLNWSTYLLGASF
jgi:hypothetical protein